MSNVSQPLHTESSHKQQCDSQVMAQKLNGINKSTLNGVVNCRPMNVTHQTQGMVHYKEWMDSLVELNGSPTEFLLHFVLSRFQSCVSGLFGFMFLRVQKNKM